jgi:MFS family permease
VAVEGALPQTGTASRWPPSTFRSLQHRNFRLLWFGNLISHSGDWMDQIAFNWLVYAMTGSAFYLGLINFCRLAPILVFTLIGGVVADRVERRWLLFTTQASAMVMAFVLAVLVSAGQIQIWMVLLIAVGRGVMNSFNQPARQSLISELVPAEDLMNAIGLNSATLNLTRVLGPALGGILIATIGVAGAFYLNGASFLAVLVALYLMRFPPRPPAQHRSLLADLLGGVRYVRTHPTLRVLVPLALLPMLFGMPYMTLLTVFAKDVLHAGGLGVGVLTAGSGIGAMTGALAVASITRPMRRGRLMLAGLVAFGVTLFAFALSPWLPASLLAVVAVGASQQIYNATNNTLVQEYVDEAYRGRVLSTLFLNRVMVPLGTMLAGIGTGFIGVQASVAVMGAALMVMALLVMRLAPTARDLR